MDLERDIPGMVEMARDRGERKVGSVDAIDEAQEAQEAKQIQDWRERNGNHRHLRSINHQTPSLS